MSKTMKSYKVEVYTSFNGCEDGTADQGLLIIDVPGYSHFYGPTHETRYGKTRAAIIKGTSKAEVSKLVKATLGRAYWQNTNIPYEIEL